MSQYFVVKVNNGKELFDKIPKKELVLENPISNKKNKVQANQVSGVDPSNNIPKKGLLLQNYKINAQSNQIRGKANGKIKSAIRSNEKEEILEDIFVDLIIKKYKIYYCIVGLSGAGLMSIHNYPKYIEENVLEPLKLFLEENYSINFQFEKFEFFNQHFSETYWKENIRSKLCYNNSTNEQMYVRISSPNCNEIIEGNEILKNYFANGVVRYITAKVPELEYPKNNLNQIGKVKFQRNGTFGCLFFDIIFFNEFIEKMIDIGFFGEVK